MGSIAWRALVSCFLRLRRTSFLRSALTVQRPGPARDERFNPSTYQLLLPSSGLPSLCRPAVTYLMLASAFSLGAGCHPYLGFWLVL